MPEKPDHYAVLGIAKTASLDEIKAAFRKIAMACHPDRQRNKTEAEKNAANEKFQFAKDAHEVLADPAKRATYDKYGHKGVADLKNTGPTGKDHTSPPAPPRKMPTAEDTFDFFDRAAEKMPKAAPDTGPRKTPEERAEERRQTREAEARKNQRSSVPATPSSPAKDVFQEASEKIKGAMVSLDILEEFRENLRDLLGKVDAAIKSRKNPEKNDGDPKF